jgi:hypothetical protein
MHRLILSVQQSLAGSAGQRWARDHNPRRVDRIDKRIRFIAREVTTAAFNAFGYANRYETDGL